MHIKFTKAGKRTAKGLAEYLLQEKNSRGAVRHEIKVLEGDPHRVARIADSLDFKDNFTHGIITWGPEDEPTEQQKDSLLAHFKRLAFGGLDETRFAFSFVEHQEQDKGRHIHFFHAKLDLQSGLKYNTASPQKGRFGYYAAWQKSYDALRDVFNYACEWTRPDDPRRMRDISLGRGNFATEGKAFTNRTALKTALCEIVLREIKAGTIKNRKDVLDTLREYGTITRTVRNSISIELEGHKKPFRLKGYIFSQDLDVAQRIKIEQMPELSPEERAARIQAASKTFTEELQKKIDYNLKRYGADRELPLPDPGQGHELMSKAIFRPSPSPLAINAPDKPLSLRTFTRDTACPVRLLSPMAVQQHVKTKERSQVQPRQAPSKQLPLTRSFWSDMAQNQMRKTALSTQQDLGIFLEQLLLTVSWQQPDRLDIPYNTIMVESEPGKWAYLLVYPDEYTPEAILFLDTKTLAVLEREGTPEALNTLISTYQNWVKNDLTSHLDTHNPTHRLAF
ncbi:hypothetical protein [Desulfonatronum parangueonense]